MNYEDSKVTFDFASFAKEMNAMVAEARSKIDERRDVLDRAVNGSPLTAEEIYWLNSISYKPYRFGDSTLTLEDVARLKARDELKKINEPDPESDEGADK